MARACLCIAAGLQENCSLAVGAADDIRVKDGDHCCWWVENKAVRCLRSTNMAEKRDRMKAEYRIQAGAPTEKGGRVGYLMGRREHLPTVTTTPGICKPGAGLFASKPSVLPGTLDLHFCNGPGLHQASKPV